MAFVFAVQEKKFLPKEAGKFVGEKYKAEIERFEIPVDKWVKNGGRKNG
jgi:hypothetical protein